MKGRIVCVDDEKIGLELRKRCLENNGYTVFATSTWSETLQTIREHNPIHLVILDFTLHGKVTGVDIAKDLRIRYPEILLIMLSGTDAREETTRQLVDKWIVKGDVQHSLLDAVNVLLGQKAQARSA